MDKKHVVLSQRLWRFCSKPTSTNSESKLIGWCWHHDCVVRSQGNTFIPLLPALQLCPVLSHKDVAASEASNSRLVMIMKRYLKMFSIHYIKILSENVFESLQGDMFKTLSETFLEHYLFVLLIEHLIYWGKSFSLYNIGCTDKVFYSV